jgi:FMN phosphatase YigB (HAD superfamily)
MIKCSPEVFARARANAEQAVWRREGGLDSNAGLPDFYIEVVRRLHLDEALVPALVNAELSLETEILRPVPSAQRLLECCTDLGLPVTFLSDTYLSADFVESRLNEMGLLPPKTCCLVSSTEAQSKASGRLFATLISSGRCPDDILHVGDHPHSDVAAPRQIGVHTRWCIQARLNKYEEQLADASPATAGLGTSLAGASRMARLTTRVSSPNQTAIRDVAAGVAAPALVGYVLWILKRAQALSLERLVFLARDGQVLAEIARRIAAALCLTLDIRYLFVSRMSTNLAATFDADEEDTGWVFRDVPWLSATEFLDRFDLQWTDVSELLETPERLTQQTPATQISTAFRNQLAGGPIRELILARAAARREVVIDYLRQEGLLDTVPHGIVDFGGVGSQVRALHALAKNAGGRVPRIFLVGLDKPEAAGLSTPLHEPDWVDHTECYLYDHRRNRGILRSRGFGTCMQMFCAADHGTVTGYRYENRAVVPELAVRIDERLIEWGLPLYRLTLFNFLDHLVIDRNLVDPYADVRDVTCELISTFWKQPERDEATAWGSFPFEGAQASGTTPRPLAYRYTLRSIIQEIAARRFPNLGWQHWYEGSLAISAPAIRVLLTRAESAYRHLENRDGLVSSAVTVVIRAMSGRS